MAIAYSLVFVSFMVKIIFITPWWLCFLNSQIIKNEHEHDESSFFKGYSHEAGIIMLGCFFRLSFLSLSKQSLC